MNKARLEAFSDGVFAIVITLMILNIHVPDVRYEDLPNALVQLLPAILAYVLSFIIIGMYWVFHHNAFHILQKTDGTLVWLNILLLLCVSFIPFPTSMLGKYPFKPVPIMLYGGTLLATNIVGFAMELYVRYHRHLASPEYSFAKRRRMRVYGYVNGIYIIALILAPFFPVVSYSMFGLVTLSLAFYTRKAK